METSRTRGLLADFRGRCLCLENQRVRRFGVFRPDDPGEPAVHQFASTSRDAKRDRGPEPVGPDEVQPNEAISAVRECGSIYRGSAENDRSGRQLRSGSAYCIKTAASSPSSAISMTSLTICWPSTKCGQSTPSASLHLWHDGDQAGMQFFHRIKLPEVAGNVRHEGEVVGDDARHQIPISSPLNRSHNDDVAARERQNEIDLGGNRRPNDRPLVSDAPAALGSRQVAWRVTCSRYCQRLARLNVASVRCRVAKG